MPVYPVEWAGFGGGLNLRAKPGEARPDECVDALNVVFTEAGAVKSRDGYGILTASEGTNRYDSLAAYYKSDGTRQLIAGATTRLEAITTAGAVSASMTGRASYPHFFARYGGPAGEYLFAANGSDQLARWDGSSWTTPSWTGTAPVGNYIAVTPWDNRMICANYGAGGAGTNRNTLRFSNAGDPTNWPSTNYKDLNPGDGQQITGLAVWDNRVFIFKTQSIWVLWGTGTDGTGQPTWDATARVVDTAVGCASPRGIAVGRDGVYFITERGVYRTDGRPAVPVSGNLDPLFDGATNDFYQGSPVSRSNIDKAALHVHRERLYVSVPTAGATNDTTLVFDTRYGWWTTFDFPAAAMASFQVTANTPELVFALASGTKHIARHSPSYTTDNSATINTRFMGAWSDLPQITGRSQVKTIRESKVWAKGSLRFGIARDFTTSPPMTTLDFDAGVDTWGDGTDSSDVWGDGTDSSDVWATGRALAPKLHRRATRGYTFAVYAVNDASTPWTLYRVVNHVRSSRGPEVLNTEA